MLPDLQAADLERILNGIADRLTTPTNTMLFYNEDDRLVLVAWADKNKLAIAEAQRRFDEEPKPEQATIQGVVYQRL